MARPRDDARRTALALQIAAYLAEHGVAGMSLRPLAAAIGTSDRMLLHYFGSKDELIRAALRAGLPELSSLGRDGYPAAEAEALWHAMTTGAQAPRVRLLLEVLALALTQERYRPLAREALDAWLGPVTHALERAGQDPATARATASLLTSGLKGLALEYALTLDRDRVDAAARLLFARVLS